MLPQTSKTRHVLPMISIQDHQQLQTEDSVSALSTATLASGAIRGACLCVTAFQMVHFQIAYHTSWWSYIVQPYEMRCWWWPYFHYMQQQEWGRNSRLQTVWQMHILWQWVRTPATLITTKAKCEGCSTWFHFISSDTGSVLLVLCTHVHVTI